MRKIACSLDTRDLPCSLARRRVSWGTGDPRVSSSVMVGVFRQTAGRVRALGAHEYEIVGVCRRAQGAPVGLHAYKPRCRSHSRALWNEAVHAGMADAARRRLCMEASEERQQLNEHPGARTVVTYAPTRVPEQRAVDASAAGLFARQWGARCVRALVFVLCRVLVCAALGGRLGSAWGLRRPSAWRRVSSSRGPCSGVGCVDLELSGCRGWVNGAQVSAARLWCCCVFPGSGVHGALWLLNLVRSMDPVSLCSTCCVSCYAVGKEVVGGAHQWEHRVVFTAAGEVEVFIASTQIVHAYAQKGKYL